MSYLYHPGTAVLPRAIRLITQVSRHADPRRRHDHDVNRAAHATLTAVNQRVCWSS